MPRFEWIKPLKKHRPLVVLAALCVGWWVLPVFVKSTLRVSWATFQAPLALTNGVLRDAQDFWVLRLHSKEALIAALRDLARLNAAFQELHQQHAALQLELQALQSWLDVPPYPGFKKTLARVVHQEMSPLWHTITLNKGSRHGLAVGQGVVAQGRVVGRVSQVTPFTAVVQLVSSPQFRVTAYFQTDGRLVVYQGGGIGASGTLVGQVEHVPLDLLFPSEQVGSLHLVSCPLGGTFPAGLSLGRTEGLQPNPDGLFQQGTVRVDDALRHLREVAVLVPERPSSTSLGLEN
jgi:rod shape-determining protein MreC